MRKNFLLVGSLSFFLAATGLAHSPQNESAKYKLDRKQARTTAVLTRGTLELNVGSFDKSIGKQGSYSSQFRYQLKTIIGDLNGAKPINIPAEFFSPDFLQTLRTEKICNWMLSKSDI